jgi:hypothetical protein
MDRLALDLAKKIPDPKSVTRAHVAPDKRKILRFQMKLWGILLGLLALLGLVILVMIKSGEVKLLLPFLLILSGSLKFAAAKGDRNDRWVGIAFICGGLLWGAIKLLEPMLNR